jgi:flagellar biosynthetic protein FliO
MKRYGIDMRWVIRRLGRRRALVGLVVIAGMFVALALIASAAMPEVAKESADRTGPVQTASSGGVSGTGSEEPGPTAVAPSPGMAGMVFKVIGSVLLLIGVLYAGMYALRVLSGRTGGRGLGSGAISVLHKTHIAPKKAIYVIKVGGKTMVVGVTDSQMTHLADLSDEELGSLEGPDKSESKRGGFRQHLIGLALGGGESK